MANRPSTRDAGARRSVQLVVGIAASADNLESLLALLRELPPQSNLCVVVVLSDGAPAPAYQQILEKVSTSLTVKAAQELCGRQTEHSVLAPGTRAHFA